MKELHPDQCTTIYLEKFKDKNPKDVKEIITALYDNYYCASLKTYQDSLCTKLQCESSKSRSFDDIYYLCKSYLPATTVKDVIEVLLNLKINDKVIYGGSCGGIKKIVISFHPMKDIKRAFINGTYDQSVSNSQHNSQWNWKELLEMIEITNNQQYNEYVKHLE